MSSFVAQQHRVAEWTAPGVLGSACTLLKLGCNHNNACFQSAHFRGGWTETAAWLDAEAQAKHVDAGLSLVAAVLEGVDRTQTRWIQAELHRFEGSCCWPLRIRIVLQLRTASGMA
jgi:hypothetical protein